MRDRRTLADLEMDWTGVGRVFPYKTIFNQGSLPTRYTESRLKAPRVRVPLSYDARGG